MERYKVGDWVICTSVTPENHEGLRVSGYYEVVGATLVDGNLVYTVIDCDGVTRFSIGDRFRKYAREDFFADDYDKYCQSVPRLYPEGVGNRYKVGDRVRLRDDLEVGGVYAMESGRTDSFVRGMEELIGEVVTISGSGKEYSINESEYSITDEMITGYAEDTDEWHYLEAYSEDDKIALDGLAVSLGDVFLTTEPVDMVNHPPHYNHGGIESIDVIRMCLTKNEFKGYLKGQVLKYRERAPYKGNKEQDYAKARFYYDMLMEMEAKKQGGK